MRLSVTILFLLFIIVSQHTNAQDKMLMTNGQALVVNKIKIDEVRKSIVYETQKGKVKEIDQHYVFSITNSSGKENIIYKVDSSAPGTFSLEQMRSFIDGQIDARENSKAPLATIIGFSAGACAPWVSPTYFYAPLFPALATSITGMTSPRAKKIIKKYPNKAQSEHYIIGYKEAAKQKRVKNAIKGGLFGLVSGILVHVAHTEGMF